jgi:hypothetical protein
MREDIEAVLTALQKAALAALNAALADRLASMGPDESGLFSYYTRKIAHDALLSQCDLQVMQILRQHVGRFARLWEIGPGVGQLTVMLALDGHQVMAVEHDRRRAAALLAMLDVLSTIDRPARDRVTVVKDTFPEVLGSDSAIERDAVICLSCAFTAPDSKYSAFEAAAARYALGVIDFARLFTETTDRAEWRRRAADFASAHGVEATAVAAFHIPQEDKHGELFVTVPALSRRP